MLENTTDGMLSLTIPYRKNLRAEIIKAYVSDAGYRGVVCFSCGNASQALQEAGLFTIAISPQGQLQTQRWWTAAEIQRTWPDLFDATSGHLSAALMSALALALRSAVGSLTAGARYIVPSGSGETLVALAMAYPEVRFRPLYGEAPALRYDKRAPLNQLVKALSWA